MIIYMILLLVEGIWIIRYWSYKKEIFEKLPRKGNELRQFYPPAYAVLVMLNRYQVRLSNQRRKKRIESLNAIEEYKETEIIYNIRRIALVMLMVLMCATLGLLYELANCPEEKITDYRIMRPNYGADKEPVEFWANGNQIKTEITAREYSLEEVQENFVKAYELLLKRILLENESLKEVRSDLNLVTYLEEYAMNVSWMSSMPEVIDVYGSVHNYDFPDEASETVVLTAMLSYLDYECRYEIDICVKAQVLDEEEKFVRNLLVAIRENDKREKYLETVSLPEQMNGVPVQYEEKKENNAYLLLILGLTAAVAVFFGMDKDLESKVKEREKQMLLDYAEIVSKLNILSGAGMSIFKAWEKIVRDYEKKMENGKEKKRFAYEEMKITYYEIQSGESESNAYSNFGKRCNIHEYLKLGALLEQNVKKGAKGLAKMLEEESVQAFEQRKNLARKLGEEAGTKLLIPMIMMLAIVMIIVLIPAFTSFSV